MEKFQLELHDSQNVVRRFSYWLMRSLYSGTIQVLPLVLFMWMSHLVILRPLHNGLGKWRKSCCMVSWSMSRNADAISDPKGVILIHCLFADSTNIWIGMWSLVSTGIFFFKSSCNFAHLQLVVSWSLWNCRQQMVIEHHMRWLARCPHLWDAVQKVNQLCVLLVWKQQRKSNERAITGSFFCCS